MLPLYLSNPRNKTRPSGHCIEASSLPPECISFLFLRNSDNQPNSSWALQSAPAVHRRSLVRTVRGECDALLNWIRPIRRYPREPQSLSLRRLTSHLPASTTKTKTTTTTDNLRPKPYSDITAKAELLSSQYSKACAQSVRSAGWCIVDDSGANGDSFQ